MKETTVKTALNTNPVFVESDQDLFELFETPVEDDYVLIGNRDEIEGIITRDDVLYFLEHQIEPFLKIGEIEESLRHLFRTSCDNIDHCLEETFADRVELGLLFKPTSLRSKYLRNSPLGKPDVYFLTIRGSTP